MAYRLTTQGFEARFDSLGRLTHLGHPDRIREQPTCFHLTGPIREGQWYWNGGNQDVFFDPEDAGRTYDLDAGTLSLSSRFRGPCAWWGLDLDRTYRIDQGMLRCDFALTNWVPPANTAQIESDGAVSSAAPVRRLRYCTGVNSWTDFSSDWAHRPYPTNLRVERDFFWAAMVSTAHDVIGYFSTGRTDSWSVQYENVGMQRIRSVSIDFVNALDAHPSRVTHQDVRLGRENPSYRGAFYVGRFPSLEAFWQKAADVLGVAFICADRCSGFSGERLRCRVIRPTDARSRVTARVRDEGADADGPACHVAGDQLDIPLSGRTGRKVVTLDAGGWSTEARIWQQDGWADILRAAGRHAARVKVASGYNYESILGLITVCQAAGLLGDDVCLAAARPILERAYAVHYDRSSGRHKSGHDRLQNYGGMLDAIRAYHRYFRTTEYAEIGQRSARQLMGLQGSDGNFYRHNSIYNNVGHPVRSLFDWGEHMRAMGRTAEADEIRESVARAYRNIARSGDDTMTEGADHFEDGMTSCAGHQIAALWPQFGRRPEDLAMARAIFQRRRMLKPRVPDSRFFAATLRHWEGYWAMGLGPCMLGGHGWNAWSAAFEHALFMATGEWRYLVESYATVSNCVQSVDLASGDFRFGFAVDPCWRDFYGLGIQHPGEEYVRVPDEIRVSSEGHQVFAALEESFFRRTYVRVMADGAEVLNGRLLRQADGVVDLESFALALDEIVVSLDAPGLAAPSVTVRGQPVAARVAGCL